MSLKTIEAEYVECRARRHLWDPIPDDGDGLKKYKPSRHTRRLVARCTRCGTKRYEAWNKITGAILGHPFYKYPKGYSLAGEGVKPWHVRREYLLRLDRLDDDVLSLPREVDSKK